MLTRAPAEMQKSATPSDEWVAPTCALMSGTRAAQLPNAAPTRAKSAMVAANTRCGAGAC